MIRAKFRCMSLTYNAETASEVRFLPVNPKGECYPDGCEENAAFWDATPSGELKIGIAHGAEVPFVVGDRYYIDMEEADEGDQRWKLWGVTQHEGNINVELGLGWSNERLMVHATLEMGIMNATAWPAFLNKAGSKWAVTLTPAP